MIQHNDKTKAIGVKLVFSQDFSHVIEIKKKKNLVYNCSLIRKEDIGFIGKNYYTKDKKGLNYKKFSMGKENLKSFFYALGLYLDIEIEGAKAIVIPDNIVYTYDERRNLSLLPFLIDKTIRDKKDIVARQIFTYTKVTGDTYSTKDCYQGIYVFHKKSSSLIRPIFVENNSGCVWRHTYIDSNIGVVIYRKKQSHEECLELFEVLCHYFGYNLL
jgi:hypothetical protein